MFEKYEHEGKRFTIAVAMELIFKTYVWKPPVDRHTIGEEVYQIHESGGGLPPWGASHEVVHSLVKLALSQLEKHGGATREEQLWRIHDQDTETRTGQQGRVSPEKRSSHLL